MGAMAMAMAMAMPMVAKSRPVQQQRLKIVSGRSLHTAARGVGLSSFALVFLLHSPVSAQSATPFSTSPSPLSAPGAAATGQSGLQIRPSISVSETYSDNVSLAPAGSERSEWTTRIAPSVSVIGNGARLRFNATYTPELLSRARQGTNDISHFLDASGNSELLQQLLYVDVRANVFQQNVSLLGAQAQDNLNTTGNRTSVKTYSVSPYLRHDFGFDAVGELRLTHDAVSYSGNTSALSGSTSNGISARLLSGPTFKLLTWNLAYDKSRVEYSDSARNVDSERISAGATRLITPNFRLGVNVGYEEYTYVTIGGAPPKGAFWSVGPEWTPTDRTRLAASIGHRYYGPSKSLDFSHRSRLTVWQLNYSENVSSSRDNALIPVTTDTAGLLNALFLSQIPDPIARQTAVQNFITLTGLPPSLTQPVNFVTESVFLEKKLQATFGIQGIRNTVMANVFSQNREALSSGASIGAGDFSTSFSTKQTGANLLWSSRLTANLASNLSVGISRSQFSTLASGADRLSYVRLGLTQQFHPKVSGLLSVNSVKNDSDRVGAGYTENSVAASLNVRF